MESDLLDGVTEYWALLVELEYCPTERPSPLLLKEAFSQKLHLSYYEELKSYVKRPSW